jgi:peptidoglycan hydrolase-like protein with peptidoglycan-binding domain
MTVQRWLPFAAMALVLGVAACSGLAAQSSHSSGNGASPTPATTTTPASVASSTSADPPTTIVKTVITDTLGPGSSGPEVKRTQQRLKDLAFDPGPIDGQFGPATQAAVWAYQKLILGLTGKAITGQVTPELWNRMEEPMNVQPLRPDASATHVEIYLPSQVLVLFVNDKPRLITHMSSGTGQDWCENGYCSTAITPGGVYKFGRRVDGWDDSVLGQLYNPVYFNYGLAVHGAYNVPLYPASHGCVRIPMHIATYFPSLVKRGDDIFLFDGVKDPEAYGAQPPQFNHKDPNATTTTVTPSTTTTTPGSTTTTAPGASTASSSVPATTTSPPATTTTTSAPGPSTTIAQTTTT